MLQEALQTRLEGNYHPDICEVPGTIPLPFATALESLVQPSG